MSEYIASFIRYLDELQERDRGGFAAIRRSVGFEPGSYVPAYPYVERFVSPDRSTDDPSRIALYIVAGLYSLNPRRSERSLASALGAVLREKDGGSIESRFISLLGADPENLQVYLRHLVSLLRAHEFGVNYEELFHDVRRWISQATDQETRDRIRRRWARDFYSQVVERGRLDEATTQQPGT